jgi:glycerol uptake facilitator-like aquaporin
LANVMFDEPIYAWSPQARDGFSKILSEAVATFGLLTVIANCVRHQPSTVPFAVGAYITAAYWFTASTSFANPAVTLARTLTDTFTGIRAVDVPGFLIGQVIGAVAATGLSGWLARAVSTAPDRKDLAIEHDRVDVTVESGRRDTSPAA